MELPLVLLIGLLTAVATWLMLSRNLIRLLLGFAVLGNAVNLSIFVVGRLTRDAPPLVPFDSATISGAFANPLPQALVLTAIVIGFATTGFVIELALRSRHDNGSDHVDAQPDRPQADPQHGQEGGR